MITKKRTPLLQKLKIALTIVTSLLLAAILAFVVFFFWAGSGTLPGDKRSEIITYSGAKVPPTTPETFTVMTCNIGYLSGMTNNQPVRRPHKAFFEKNMKTFLQLLNDNQPGFIALQEIDFYSHRSHYVNQLKTIAQNAGYPYAAKAVNWDKRYVPFPYWPPSGHFGRMLSGQAVLSRYPILDTQRIVLQKPATNPFYYNAFYLHRLVQAAKIKIDNRCLIILNAHLEAWCRETREKQANVVLDIYRSYKDKYPVLLMGDFNSTPPTAPQKRNFPDEPQTDFSPDKTIETFLEEKSLKAAELINLTFPAGKPTRKLDYIFYNHEKITLIEVSRPDIDSSDHLPLVMTFALKATDRS
jgi:endonuclease/exonuclease/phosphatase family metal-dependent hydrolase